MSLIEELGSRLSASSAELPLGELLTALDKLRAAAAALAWVRQQSANPLGVPGLSGSIEHLEHAVHALRVAQDGVAGYLAALGLTTQATPLPDRADDKPDPTDRPEAQRPVRPEDERPPGRRPGLRPPPGPEDKPEPEASDPNTPQPRPVPVPEPEQGEGPEPPAGRPEGKPEPVRQPAPAKRPPVPRLPRWWPERVAYLTDGAQPEPGTGRSTANKSTAAELLRAVARRAANADRDGLRRELADAPAPVGLDLAALAPGVLHRLATDLLGHQPKAEDLPALTRAARGPVLDLLPKLPPGIVDTLLARVCKVPPGSGPDRGPKAVPHPADTAVTHGVLVGVLMHKLGRDPDSLDAGAPA